MLTYLHGDHLGSASLATDASGTKITDSGTRYSPYGMTRPGLAGTGLPTDRRFTGQREEPSLGFYDYGARPYAPALGRFLQADTIVPNPADPQSLNRYSYVNNNPLRYTDPSGHWFETLWDIANIGWDIYEVQRDPGNAWNWAALVLDVGAAVLPVVPGGVGLVVRGGKALSHADEVVDAGRVLAEAASHADEVADVARAANRLDDATDVLRGVENATEAAGVIRSNIRPARELLTQRVLGTDVHHLIEQRFAKRFGLDPNDMPAVRLDKTFYQQEVTARLFSELPTNPHRSYTAQDVWTAYQRVYGPDGLNRLDWLKAIWPYFERLGVQR